MRSPKATPQDLAFYEGLVRKTASMYERLTEEEFDDLCQILRLKVWRALGTYDPSRSKLPIERYVFSCVRNQCKDLVKKKRRNELFIEDVAPGSPGNAIDFDSSLRNRFEAQYLMVREDEAFADLPFDQPLIPSTLTHDELQVMGLLYLDYGQTEIALRLAMTKREVAAAVKALREKMSDWKPSTGVEAQPLATGDRSDPRSLRIAEPVPSGELARRAA